MLFKSDGDGFNIDPCFCMVLVVFWGITLVFLETVVFTVAGGRSEVLFDLIST